MSLDDLETWNEHLRNAGLPLELHGKLWDVTPPSETFEACGETKLRVLQGDSPTVPEEIVASLPVRVVLVADPKVLHPLPWELRRDDFVLAPAITPKVADNLRRHGIMFADRRGNCFVSSSGILIDSRGKTSGSVRTRRADEAASLRRRAVSRTASLFTPRRAQVSALLLSHPSLLEASIREVALHAEVSVGTANQTFALLTEAGYLRKTSAGYRIDSVDTLLDAWTHAYPTGLGSSRQLFRGVGDLEQLTELEPLGWISGESAVSDLVHGGGSAHLYVEDEPASRRLIRAARLRQDVAGGVVIRSAFWDPEGQRLLEARQPTPPHRGEGPLAMWQRAPLAVIYADLMSVDDPRLSDVAQQIKREIEERTDG